MTVGSMLSLAAALCWGTQVTPGWAAVAFGALLGIAANMIRTVEAATLPRYFGTRHIGSIRGLVASISVGGTACGPLLFAAVFDRVGSYAPVLLASAAVPVGIAVWAAVAREPDPTLFDTPPDDAVSTTRNDANLPSR